MTETRGNIFNFPTAKNGTEAICVTTNGIIKKDGRAVMGAGVAKAFKERYADIDLALAEHLRTKGNVVGNLRLTDGYYIVSYPTKNHWVDDSDINLIVQSAHQLVTLANELKLTRIWLPKPGCSNGHLNWSDVKSAIENILDDRFIIVSL